ASGEIVEYAAILRVEAILAHAQIHRARRDGVADPAHVSTREPLDEYVGAVAMRTAEGALVGESNPNPESQGRQVPLLPLLRRPIGQRCHGYAKLSRRPRSRGRTPAPPAGIQWPEEGRRHGDNHG